jgi:hypothetical protein
MVMPGRALLLDLRPQPAGPHGSGPPGTADDANRNLAVQ